VGVIGCIAVVSALRLVAQDRTPPPQFRAGVEVVRLDVAVLDRDRVPVRDLRASNFTVLEDGAPRPIVSFNDVSGPEPDGSLVPWMREVSRLDLKPGRYILRFAAHNSTSGKSGSVYHDIEIPEFAKEPVSLSGVLVSVSPPLTAVPKDSSRHWCRSLPRRSAYSIVAFTRRRRSPASTRR
jgi:hypothetical protein